MNELLMRFNEIRPQKTFHTIMANAKNITADEFNKILMTWGVTFDRSEILTQPLYEMVTGLLNVFGANDVKDNRLAAWLGYVYQQSLKIGYGLYDLLDDWKLQEEKLSIQIPEDVNAVRVMTIHAAKGLDWPVVILAQGNWRVSHQSHSFWVELPDAKPIPAALLPHNSRVEKTIFKEQYQQEVDAVLLDSINAMYVAFTRPSQRLYVFAIKPKEGFFKELMPILTNINHPKVRDVYAEINYISKGGVKTSTELISWSYGATEFHDGEKKEEDSNLIQLSNRRNSAYQKKLKVKKNYMKRMNNSGQRDFGNLVHKAFSFIETANDVAKAVNDLWKSGEVNDTEKVELTNHIHRVISHRDVAHYFTGSVEIKNEAEIILANGDLLRPDRVLISQNTATVIDFKTGMKKNIG
jgi:ATP-dependent exoDNAse (exonuclease V) beta subunit